MPRNISGLGQKAVLLIQPPEGHTLPPPQLAPVSPWLPAFTPKNNIHHLRNTDIHAAALKKRERNWKLFPISVMLVRASGCQVDDGDVMGSSPPGSPQFLRSEKSTGQTNPSQPHRLLLGHLGQDPGWGSSQGAAARAAEKQLVSYSSLPRTHALQRLLNHRLSSTTKAQQTQCRRRAPHHTGTMWSTAACSRQKWSRKG